MVPEVVWPLILGGMGALVGLRSLSPGLTIQRCDSQVLSLPSPLYPHKKWPLSFSGFFSQCNYHQVHQTISPFFI